MDCNLAVCPDIPRTQTAYLWRATVNNVNLCYSYEVCGGVDYFSGEASVCLGSGGFYINGACTCPNGLYMMTTKEGVQKCGKVRA